MQELDLFAAAIALTDPAERVKLLDRECVGQPQLRERMELLMAAHFRSHPLVDQAEFNRPTQSPSELEPTMDRTPVLQKGSVLADRYHLLEPIGEGGMGEVWVAQQSEPVKRKVAIKLIKAGMDSRAVLARFEAERQALAVMDHPQIAKVLDGGTTAQGRPFFVMELVRGIPITEYCDQVQYSVRERLELFGQVCSAVQHAHQKGIIHRDLKPSNILVTEYDGRPVCKVIDFGLAKALHGAYALTEMSLHTAFGAVIGTPLYMAPEQLGTSALDVDTRGDLYSLGVVLYELLTGTTPIERQRLKEAAWDEIRRIVREEEPPRPSLRLSSSETLPSVAARRHVEPARLTNQVRGDLDWIVMKALEKDRNRRYETANGMAMDIQRHLAGEAVLAAPASRRYRLQKFVRRHRGPVLAASLLLLALLGGIAGTSYGLFRANQAAESERLAKLDAQEKQLEAENQQARAEEREQQAIDAVKRFRDAVADNSELKNNASLDALRKSLLTEPLKFFQLLRERLQADNDTRPESLARLADAAFDLGTLTNEIGDKQDALRAFQESQVIVERLVRDQPSVTVFQRMLASSLNNIGMLLSATGKSDEAPVAFERALKIWERLVELNPTPQDQAKLATSHNNIGVLLMQQGELNGALTAYEQARAIRVRLARENPTIPEFQDALAASYNNIGTLLRASNKPVEAMDAQEQARAVRERLVEQNPTVIQFQSDLAVNYFRLGELLSDTGRSAEALAAYEQAREMQERLVLENPTVTEFQSDLAASLGNIGLRLRIQGKLDAALAANERALEILKQLVRANPAIAHFQHNLGGTLNNVALLELAQKRFADARDRLLDAVDCQKRALDLNPRNPSYRQFLKNHYTNLLKAAAGLSDTGLAAEAQRGLAELAASDPKFEALDQRMSNVLGGEQANGAQELLDLGKRAYDIQRFALAARFWTDALASDAALAEDRETQHAYNAACAAVLAGSGQGRDDPPSDDKAKAQLRGKALELLQAELDRWTRLLISATPQQRQIVTKTLAHWQTDPDLSAVRNDALDTLPESERGAWRMLWQQVEQLLDSSRAN